MEIVIHTLSYKNNLVGSDKLFTMMFVAYTFHLPVIVVITDHMTFDYGHTVSDKYQ